ncbi:phenylacetate-coenzyme A ligase [Longimycelium tulufanense]|uniref:Phenylacetate-coenzyme A ligase n=1 Tax=Longimycelium tulufanense TaxID=907463 RepID=A0A8J3FTU1_9PSEU|nr:AMP-binding protein [Longimycelium tulufanense]GGM49407.1 phenylacetate-coenzyme A ligase [Longimycelium tulufanense]
MYTDLGRAPGRLADLPVVDHERFWAANTLTDNQVLTGPLSNGLVFRSGGTTGTPKFAVYTHEEWRTFTAAFGRGIAAAGVRTGDRVANLFYAGDLYASFSFVSRSLEQAAPAVLELQLGGRLPVAALASPITDFAVTVLAGLPTTVLALAEHLVMAGRTLPHVRLILFGGELFFADQQPLVAAAFPNAVIGSLGYASVDAGLLGCPTGGEDTRVHRVFTPETVVEILDETTGQPITGAGQPGKIVLTNLTRRLLPILRYPVGDRAEWVDPDAGLFRLLGRSEEGARVGPVALQLTELQEVVAAADHDGRISGVQVVLRHLAGRDQLVLRLVAGGPGLDTLAEAVRKQLDADRPLFADQVATDAIHPLAVEWIGASELAVNPRTGKQLRLVDERTA